MSGSDNAGTSIVDEGLRLGAGFSAADRPWLVESLASLGAHLARWEPDQVDLQISVKHRDGKEQQVTLQADLPGYPPLVAHAVDRDLDHAVAEAKRDLIRQVEDEKKKREPKNNRLLRVKAREPGPDSL
jgi:ribosome-associated translation inhibitor RaiA